jgi:nickel-dependent lactate racemase
MFSVLRYGAGSSIRLERSDETPLAERGNPSGPPLADLRAAVSEAIASPLEYPPLGRAITPADRVVLALEDALPRAPEIVAAVIDCLVGGGVDPAGLTVLQTAGDTAHGAPDPRRALPVSLRDQVTLATHDPGDRDRMTYLAASHRGNPILLNRVLVDADMVLPIGRLGNYETAVYHGIHAAVFPTFSDETTHRRFRRLEFHDSQQPRKKPRVHECDEVGWLLGLNFTIQVVPGPGDEVLHVVAGHFAAVRRRGGELYDAAWDSTVPRRASLVVAAIEGSAPRQTWQNVGRALAAAVPLVEDGGAIALCCDLAGEPGPAVRRLAESPSREDALQQISEECPADTFAAVQVAVARERADLYLLSRLDESLVEQLQIAPLSKPQELARLVRRHDSCILLANAPHAHVTVAED